MKEILCSSLVGDPRITEANKAKKRAELEAQVEEKLRSDLAMEALAVAAKAAAAYAAVPAAADNSNLIKQLLPILLAQAMGTQVKRSPLLTDPPPEDGNDAAPTSLCQCRFPVQPSGHLHARIDRKSWVSALCSSEKSLHLTAMSLMRS